MTRTSGETEMLVEVEDPDLGPLLQHNVMWRMSETPGAIRFTGRALGADTDARARRARLHPRRTIAELEAEREPIR